MPHQRLPGCSLRATSSWLSCCPQSSKASQHTKAPKLPHSLTPSLSPSLARSLSLFCAFSVQPRQTIWCKLQEYCGCWMDFPGQARARLQLRCRFSGRSGVSGVEVAAVSLRTQAVSLRTQAALRNKDKKGCLSKPSKRHQCVECDFATPTMLISNWGLFIDIWSLELHTLRTDPSLDYRWSWVAVHRGRVKEALASSPVHSPNNLC